MNVEKVLIDKINKSLWWHVTPQDPNAYKKRGKFLASTYHQAEFYGKPNDEPEKVKIVKPLWADSEISILSVLFPEDYKEISESVNSDGTNWYQRRIDLDAKMNKKAKEVGYDSIVLLGSAGINALKKNQKPRSIELNLVY